MKRLTATLVLVLLLFCTTTPETAKAGGIGVFATEITQLLNHAELIEQYVKQASMLQTQLQQYAVQLTNAQTLTSQLFGPIQSDLLRLAQIQQGGQALSYSMANLDSEFSQRYGSAGYNPNVNFTAQYQQWSQTSLDTTQKSLDTVGLQYSQMQSEQDLLNSYDSMAKSSGGELQATQVGAQIAEQQVQQLMKLRELMMTDMQTKAAFQAQQVMDDQHKKEALQNFWNSQDLQAGGSSFGDVPSGSNP
jgi:type IV secretion system protein TrbJ